MTIGRHVAGTLAALKTALVTEMPLRINALETELAITITDPAAYDVMTGRELELDLPAVVLEVEGDALEDQYLTPQTDIPIPLRISVLHRHGNDDPESLDALSWHYARCAAEALNNIARNVAGVWHCIIQSTGIESWGADDSGGVGVVRATVFLRTTRIR